VPGTTRCRLVAQQVQQVRTRANESDTRRGAGSRERGIFGEKTVARMDGVDAAIFRQRHDAIDIEIGLNRSLALADQIGFIRFKAMQAEAIFVGIDAGGADLQFVGGAENSDGDFSAIQGQKFFYRHRSVIPKISSRFHCVAMAGGDGMLRLISHFVRFPVQRKQGIRLCKLSGCWPTTW
jgi:hypothetical protein